MNGSLSHAVASGVAAVLVMASPARADEWQLRATWGNDLFTELDPPIDDSGFTNDLGLALRRQRGMMAAGATVRHRMITEVFGRRRWDQLDVLFTAEQRWRWLTGSARLGPSIGGDLGGRAIQNTWHRLTRSGPTLDEGLQSDYEGDHRLGLVVGIQLRGHLGPPAHQLYAIADGQLALGSTGLSFVELGVGTRASRRLRHVALGVHLELAASRFSVDDPNLTLRGAYDAAGAGTHVAYRAGLHATWSCYQLEYTYRSNEGGSGEPIGVLELVVVRQ